MPLKRRMRASYAPPVSFRNIHDDFFCFAIFYERLQSPILEDDHRIVFILKRGNQRFGAGVLAKCPVAV